MSKYKNMMHRWREWRLNEAVKVQGGPDPLTVQNSLLDAFKSIIAKGTLNWGYTESDQYGWNDFNNFRILIIFAK